MVIKKKNVGPELSAPQLQPALLTFLLTEVGICLTQMNMRIQGTVLVETFRNQFPLGGSE